ncbi:hypothetical protein Scep_026862 [Stephania cephalantha]|uniref:PPM-type phosphatase domain-containing protein n=1 Tax=Stephania cephalantha TaxID=152367 RepID=A0AAP0ET72_9MAGN
MGGGFSRRLFPCIALPENHRNHENVIFAAEQPLDETLGHSFCYVPTSSARFLSPTHSGHLSPPHSGHLSPPSDLPEPRLRTAASGKPVFAETAFRSISGASVSANTYTPRTVLQHDDIYDPATEHKPSSSGSASNGFVSGFEGTASFTALPLQPAPRRDARDGADRGFFMSGPIAAMSGPLDGGEVPFSAPLNGIYVKRRRKRGFSGIRKALRRSSSEKKRPWVVPVLNFGGRKDGARRGGAGAAEEEEEVQWAHGKAGEDRVHVVVSEEHGWLFVGIYDGFNGPDAPEFLMTNLYRAVFNELKGLFWEAEEVNSMVGGGGNEGIVGGIQSIDESVKDRNDGQVLLDVVDDDSSHNHSIRKCLSEPVGLSCGSVKRVTFLEREAEEEEERREERRGKPLWQFLAEDDTDDGFDLSGSDRFAFSVDVALNVSDNAGSVVKRGSLLLSKLKWGLSKHWEGGQGQSRRFLPWRHNWEEKEKSVVEDSVVNASSKRRRKRKIGPVDHELVLGSLSRALEITELAYLDMTDRVLDRNPELALMGSCLLVVLMRDEDVYVMNLGDSRAIVAQYQPETRPIEQGNSGSGAEGIVEESISVDEELGPGVVNEVPAQTMRLAALQLSTDHSTSIEEEVLRIQQEHPDDSQCILNDRVKGRLKVTRAFGAGFLKQYLSNEEVVSHVENFMEKFPDGDPAQHLIEELLFRAAKKAGESLVP